LAASQDDVDTLRRLIEHRCSVNCADYDKRTPLMLAASNARLNACTFLLEVDANPALEDRYGHTALDDATRESLADHAVVLTLLQARGCLPGSHSIASTASSAHVDGERAAAQRQAVEDLRHVLGEVKMYNGWVLERRKGVSKLKASVERAIALEREQGPVLDTARPGLLVNVVDHARIHHDNLRFLQEKLSIAIQDWKTRVAFGQMVHLEKQVETAVALHQGASPHLGRLAESPFEVVRGSAAPDPEDGQQAAAGASLRASESASAPRQDPRTESRAVVAAAPEPDDEAASDVR